MLKGQHHSEEARRKISEGHKGKLPSNFNKCIVKNQFKEGHEVPEEYREKISQANKGNRFAWKRGKTIHQGYIRIYSPEHPKAVKKYVFEHILVVEKFICRYLKPGECVHHLNGNKLDNRIENLMLFETNAKHLKFHARVRQYGYLTTPIITEIVNRWDKFL